MNNKIKRLLTTIILFLIPLFLNANQIETRVSADSITVESGEILRAEGNVLIQYGESKIKANFLEFDQKTKVIKLKGLQELKNSKSKSLSAKEAVLSSDLSEGIIKAANLLIDNSIKIYTEEVQLKDDQIFSATGISRVTSCEECEGKEPNWHLSASSAKIDSENSNIIYRDVLLRVKGLPIAYIPYLGMPDPSVNRAKRFSSS